jgi:hypothetical protein
LFGIGCHDQQLYQSKYETDSATNYANRTEKHPIVTDQTTLGQTFASPALRHDMVQGLGFLVLLPMQFSFSHLFFSMHDHMLRSKLANTCPVISQVYAYLANLDPTRDLEKLTSLVQRYCPPHRIMRHGELNEWQV